MEPTIKPAPKNKRQITVSISFLVQLALLLIIVGMLVIWKPWQSSVPENSRKITVSGEATLKAEPDQFQFNPYYERDTTEEITKLNNEIIQKLKEIGVSDSQIKNNASSYGSPEIYYMEPIESKEKTVLNLTITIDNKELVQKIQDYIVTTDPKGSITPSPSFSKNKQKDLENKARDEAITDARSKAEKTAQGLGAKIGKVIEITEGTTYGFGGCSRSELCVSPAMDASAEVNKSLQFSPGEDEYSYSVSVVFAIK